MLPRQDEPGDTSFIKGEWIYPERQGANSQKYSLQCLYIECGPTVFPNVFSKYSLQRLYIECVPNVFPNVFSTVLSTVPLYSEYTTAMTCENLASSSSSSSARADISERAPERGADAASRRAPWVSDPYELQCRRRQPLANWQGLCCRSEDWSVSSLSSFAFPTHPLCVVNLRVEWVEWRVPTL